MKLELARTGSYNGVEITPEDLLSMAETFTSDVPVTIGHESEDSMPAFGWLKSVALSEDGTVLTGDIELGSELAEAFAEGKYKHWSIGASRDDAGNLYLHHVAFLGAVPPMIKDLKIIEMGDRSKFITFTHNTAEFIMSDREMAEYAGLKSKRAKERITALKSASEGKLPLRKHQALLNFADAAEKTNPELNIAGFLAEVFSSVRLPAQAGASNQSHQTQRITKPLFSKF